jgi:hypothetical protein
LRGTVRIIAGEEVRISTWKRHRIERLQSGPGPLPRSFIALPDQWRWIKCRDRCESDRAC